MNAKVEPRTWSDLGKLTPLHSGDRDIEEGVEYVLVLKLSSYLGARVPMDNWFASLFLFLLFSNSPACVVS